MIGSLWVLIANITASVNVLYSTLVMKLRVDKVSRMLRKQLAMRSSPEDV